MQTTEQMEYEDGIAPIITHGQAPYKYVLIIGPDHEEVIEAIEVPPSTSAIIIGDGKTDYDILKTLGAFQEQIAEAAMIDIACHAYLCENTGRHFSRFKENELTHSLKILEKLRASAEHNNTSKQQRVISYYSCQVTSLLEEGAPDDMLLVLYGTINRGVEVFYNAASIARKLRMFNYYQSNYYQSNWHELLAIEIAKSAETKLLYCSTKGETYIYRHAPDITVPPSYDQWRTDVCTAIEEYRKEFASLMPEDQSQLMPANVHDFLAYDDYEQYVIHSFYIALDAENILFFQAMQEIPIITDALLQHALEYCPNSFSEECLEQCFSNIVNSEQYTLFNHFFASATIKKEIKQRIFNIAAMEYDSANYKLSKDKKRTPEERQRLANNMDILAEILTPHCNYSTLTDNNRYKLCLIAYSAGHERMLWIESHKLSDKNKDNLISQIERYSNPQQDSNNTSKSNVLAKTSLQTSHTAMQHDESVEVAEMLLETSSLCFTIVTSPGSNKSFI